MEDSSLSHSISDPTALEGVYADYTINFTSPLPIDSSGGCFVKFVFPAELDISDLNLQTIEGSGLFVDSDGVASTNNSASQANLYFDDPQTLVLEGCSFDPSTATATQLSSFRSDFFSVTFKGILNPIPASDLSPFVISVYKSMNTGRGELSALITEASGFYIGIDSYYFPLDDQRVQCEVSNQFRGEYSQYSIGFETDRMVESGGGCYVKYLFPAEIDLS